MTEACLRVFSRYGFTDRRLPPPCFVDHPVSLGLRLPNSSEDIVHRRASHVVVSISATRETDGGPLKSLHRLTTRGISRVPTLAFLPDSPTFPPYCESLRIKISRANGLNGPFCNDLDAIPPPNTLPTWKEEKGFELDSLTLNQKRMQSTHNDPSIMRCQPEQTTPRIATAWMTFSSVGTPQSHGPEMVARKSSIDTISTTVPYTQITPFWSC